MEERSRKYREFRHRKIEKGIFITSDVKVRYELDSSGILQVRLKPIKSALRLSILKSQDPSVVSPLNKDIL